MQCPQCGKKLSFLRTRLDQKYCSETHQWAHLEELNRLRLAVMVEQSVESFDLALSKTARD